MDDEQWMQDNAIWTGLTLDGHKAFVVRIDVSDIRGTTEFTVSVERHGGRYSNWSYNTAGSFVGQEHNPDFPMHLKDFPNDILARLADKGEIKKKCAKVLCAHLATAKPGSLNKESVQLILDVIKVFE